MFSFLFYFPPSQVLLVARRADLRRSMALVRENRGLLLQKAAYSKAVQSSPHIKMTFVNCRFAINFKKKCAFYRLIIDFIDKFIS